MTRKLDKEHLDEIQKLQTLFATNANTIGSISLEQIAINRRIEYLNSEQERYYTEFETLRKQEQELLDKMRERYGDGQINIAEGTFTPDSGLTQ
jgi:predicted transcriptional regulator